MGVRGSVVGLRFKPGWGKNITYSANLLIVKE